MINAPPSCLVGRLLHLLQSLIAFVLVFRLYVFLVVSQALVALLQQVMADMSIVTSPAFLAEDNGPSVIATASLMIIFCTLFVGMRYYARYLTSTSFNIEDVIIPFAWLAEVGLCVVGIGM